MKTLILSIGLLITTLSFSQYDLYLTKMTSAIENLNKCKTPNEFEKVTIYFEQIANVESEKWLPKYYIAFAYVLASYSEKQENGVQKDAYLDKAEDVLKELGKLEPKESEIFALKSFFYTARLIVDPMSRGMKYSMLSNKALSKALNFDANNPRAKQLKIANSVGMAMFFGKDIKEDCQKAETLLSVWDDYELRSAVHPSWGKDYLIDLVENCQPKDEIKNNEIATDTTGITLTVKINKLISNNGQVLIKLVDKNEKTIKNSIAMIVDNKALIEFTGLKKGTYAVQFFHDENSNMKFDMGSRGPEEGYGYSNNAKGFMSAPKFKKQKIEVKENLTIELITRN